MSRERREILYSIVIIILIPVLFAVNTVLFTNNLRNNFNTELQQKSDVVNYVLAQAAKQYIVDQKDTTKLQNLITNITKEHPEIKSVYVYIPVSNGYEVQATSDASAKKLSSTDSLQLDIVSKRKRAVSKLIQTQNDKGQDTRAWDVATPLQDDTGAVVAIVSSQVLTTDADELVDATISRAFIVVIASTIVVMLLLVHHFKFVGYADLLKRQKEVNQTMSDFLSVATHELKAPMSIIKGFTANMIEGDFGTVPDKMNQPLQTVMQQTDRLNNLVTDLLNISRIEQGRITFDMQPVDVVATVHMILQNYQDRAKEKNIELIYTPDAQTPLVFADAGRVQEIMTNLIDNAIKYSVRGTVTIAHQVSGQMLITKVKDTGIGMSSEERQRLFQRFYRVKNDQTKDIAGTGLGLWIIKQYIEKMGGKIEVDSLVGSGTEFSVWLKVAQKPKA